MRPKGVHGVRPHAYARLAAILLTVLALSDRVRAQSPVPGVASAAEDTLSAVQSDDGFNSLEDGQPGDPGELELQPDLAAQILPDRDDSAHATVELQYTLPWKSLQDLQLQLTVTAMAGDGDGDTEDLTASWQHRWVANSRLMLTVATLLEVDFPIGEGSSGTDGTLTGIVIKSFGRKSVYWNGFLVADEDGALQQRGLRLGYKFPATESASLIADYVIQDEEGSAPQNIVELSADYDVNNRLSIGPGIIVGLSSGHETPRFGAGMRMVLSF